jgi:hypothetical protein
MYVCMYVHYRFRVIHFTTLKVTFSAKHLLNETRYFKALRPRSRRLKCETFDVVTMKRVHARFRSPVFLRASRDAASLPAKTKMDSEDHSSFSSFHLCRKKIGFSNRAGINVINSDRETGSSYTTKFQPRELSYHCYHVWDHRNIKSISLQVINIGT